MFGDKSNCLRYARVFSNSLVVIIEEIIQWELPCGGHWASNSGYII